ncbi:MAG: NAD-dependent epimerase/dehydratase family protein [Actinobacteria bacterium]|nr:NAD-dependent epimerase/dehydratase family protein [Actinomycetota bacterium]
MAASVVAVTGISGFLGQQLAPRLEPVPGVTRIVGLDVRESPRRTAHLEHHRVDIAGHDLQPLLAGVDTVVHLAAVVDPIADDALMARVNVHGTRRVLDAAAAVGARTVIRVSTAAAYGAWPTNPVPLTEDAPLRPNPGFGPAVQAAEVERMLYEWQREHPDVTVTTLRAAPVLGAGAAHLWARLLTAPGRVRVRGEAPPVQVVHVDDVVSALLCVVHGEHPGVFNVAAEGWLGPDAVAALVPPATMPALPSEVLRRALARTWATGVGDIPLGVVPYLVHPWVVASDRLEALGWRPAYSIEETLMETVDAAPTSAMPSLRTIAIVAGATAAGIAAGLTLRSLRRRAMRR